MQATSLCSTLSTKNNWNATWDGKFEAKILKESPGPRKNSIHGHAREYKQKGGRELLKRWKNYGQATLFTLDLLA